MFDRVHGHERVKLILSRMIAKDSLPHGLCFHGPNGIGKRLVAHETARAMLCDQRTGCGDCRHCRKFDHGNHPDFKEIVPDGPSIKVDQIREIAENLHYRPFEGRARFFVLDRVERFRDEAANAFLKSLEEPPEYVYFMLITADLKALLSTIRSRCQKVGFQSLKIEDKVQILKERFGKDEALAERLAGVSFRQLETEDEAWDLFIKDIEHILVYLNMMLTEGHAIDYFSDTVRDKAVFPRFLDHLTALVREVVLLASGLPCQPVFQPFEQQIRQLAERRPARLWRDMWEKIVRLNGLQRLNLNASLWFNSLSVSGLDLLDRSKNQIKARQSRVR